MSAAHNWRYSVQWADDHRQYLSKTAYASLLLVSVGPAAASQKALKAFPALLIRSLSRGRPRGRDLALFAGMWLVPRSLRQKIRKTLTRNNRGKT
jgi:hypothetical protein